MSKKAIPWILALITVGLLAMNLRSQPALTRESVANERAYQGGGRVQSSEDTTPSTDVLAEPLVAVVPNPTPVEIEDEENWQEAAQGALELKGVLKDLQLKTSGLKGDLQHRIEVRALLTRPPARPRASPSRNWTRSSITTS